MASIKQRGTGWWQLDWRDANGDRQRVSLGFIAKEEAEAALAAKEYELRTGHALFASAGKIPSFAAFAEDYLRWFEAEYPTSYKRVAGIVSNVLVKSFGAYPLDMIKVKVVENWKATRAKEFSQRGGARVKPETVNKELRQLKAMLNKAVEWEVIKSFPWPTSRSVKQLRKEKAPPKFYTEAQIAALYVAAGYKRWWWQLYVNTGMRKAEGLHLKWSEVRDDSIVILSTDEERTKSDEYRVVPLNEKAAEALKQIAQQAKRGLHAGDEHSTREYTWHDDYVLPRMHINSLGRAFARDAKRAKIGGNIHRLRHTFCTHLAMKGHAPKVIQELAGHASMETTMGYMWSRKQNERAAVRSISL